jgi:hypothetical protein
LNEDNEEIVDRRISTIVKYDTEQTPIHKIRIKKLNNNIKISEPLSTTNQIHSMVYSNKYGLLAFCCGGDVIVTNHQNMETMVFDQDGQTEFKDEPKEFKKLSKVLCKEGKIYMSPD